MRKILPFGLAVCCATASMARAQTPVIDHQPVACAAVDKFPRLEARFSPAASVATARVVFQGQTTEWYSVAMKLEGEVYAGVLPRPKKDLKSFRYYIDVTDKAMGTNRTTEFTTSVVDSAGACKGKVMAGALSSASVILQGPAGVVALPAGFASTGVVAAGSAAGSSAGASGAAAAGGGGLSTGAVVGIAAGVAAAGAGAAVVAKGGDDEAPENTGTPYSGPFSAQYTVTQVAVGNVTNTCAYVRSLTGTMKVTLKQGSGSPGDAQLDLTEEAISSSGTGCTAAGPSCCGPQTFMCALTGTSGSMACGEQRSTSSNGQTNVRSFNFSGSLSGGAVSGVVTYSNTGSGNSNGSSVSHTGSANLPVTLR